LSTSAVEEWRTTATQTAARSVASLLNNTPGLAHTVKISKLARAPARQPIDASTARAVRRLLGLPLTHSCGMALLKLWWLTVPTVVARSTGEPGTATSRPLLWWSPCETSSARRRDYSLPLYKNVMRRQRGWQAGPGHSSRRLFEDLPSKAATAPVAFVMRLQHACLLINTCTHGREAARLPIFVEEP
jgi:hypothetical protein